MWFVKNSLLMGMLVSLTCGAIDNRCQDIVEPICQNIGYDMTSFPNVFGHNSQDEASVAMAPFATLAREHCTQNMRFLVCSLYTPICMTNYRKYLPACRDVCHRAFAECQLPEGETRHDLQTAILGQLVCDDLPEYGDPDDLCMSYSYDDLETESTTAPMSEITLPPHRPTSVTSSPSNSIAQHNTPSSSNNINLDECSCKIQCDCPAIP